jgi:phosphatidylserine/phosphatidylglycerophosphate/cardiolipin synthase-like enzyme
LVVIEAQRKGRDVRIILSQWQLMNGWLDRLQQAGIGMDSVRIQHGVHNKGFVVDSTTVMLGSQNWSGDGTPAEKVRRDHALSRFVATA